MTTIIRALCLAILCWNSTTAIAQGPPILGDKPIMLGANRAVFKTLTEFRKTNEGIFWRLPAMVHYLPTSNMLVGGYIPMVNYHFADQDARGEGTTLGDIELLYKYQFYRKDGTGKTFRVVAKTLQTLPTGKKLDLEGMSTGLYQGYYGIVAGYESIKYGISSELGYQWSPLNLQDEVRLKAGIGLPLLKPSYPVNQVNLFFEYQASYFVEQANFMVLYGQGIQYAKGRFTFEAALQLPLWQQMEAAKIRQYSIYLGMRYVL